MSIRFLDWFYYNAMIDLSFFYVYGFYMLAVLVFFIVAYDNLQLWIAVYFINLDPYELADSNRQNRYLFSDPELDGNL